MRFPVLWRRVRVRFWWWMRHRVSRRRRSATPILALDAGLEIVPVINKIDLPAADAPRVKQEIEDIIGIPAEDSPEISAKMSINIHEVLERIVTDIPAPEGDADAPLRALDVRQPSMTPYKGVIVYMRLLDGKICPGMTRSK